MSRTIHNGCSPNRASRLRLESLEDRTLLNASPTISLAGLSVSGNYASDHILVRYQQGTAPVALNGTSVAGPVGLVANLYKVNLSSGVAVDAALAAYRADGRVAAAEADHLLGTSATPNDPRYAEQWAMNGVSRDANVAGAWDRTTGTSRFAVALMDTGLDYTHPDLYQNVWINQAEIPSAIRARLTDVDGDGRISFRDLADSRNVGAGKAIDVNNNGRIDGGDLIAPLARGGWADGVSNDGDRYVDDLVGWNFFDDNNDPMDTGGHGTHVAGIVGAAGNNGVGVSGVAWNVPLMPLRFIGPSGGTVSQFIAALDYAIANGAKVSNNSWSGAANSQLLIDAVTAARDAGHVFVAAAGNNALDNDQLPAYPASLDVDNVISVAATDRNGALTSFSNYGRRSVDLAAPGVEILSTTPGGGYALTTGTSMATPFVTGAVALVWAKNPSWTYKQVITQVLGTAEKSTALEGKVATAGIVNVAAAVGSAQTASTVAAKITSSQRMGPTATTLSSVRVTFDRAMNFSTFTAADATLKLPNGATIAASNVKKVDGSGDKSFDVVFALQSAPGTYTLKVGPNVKDAAGLSMAAFTGTYALPTATATAPKITSSQRMGPTATTLSSVRVTFDRAMNFSTFTAADATLKLPNGATIAASNVKEVSGSAGKSFDVVFALQSAPGTYTLKVGPIVKDAAGLSMAAFTGTYALPTATATAPKITSSQAVGSTAGTISSVRVTFDRAIQVGTFTAVDCTLTGPNAVKIAVSNVKAVGTDGKTFDVVFSVQNKAGAYTLKVGTDVKDLAGTNMTAFQGTYRVGGQVTYTTTTKATMPGGQAVAMLAVSDAATIADLNVKITITHPRLKDLDIHLQAPDGTRVLLMKLMGGTSGNMKDTVFDDEAATHVALGSAPYTGSFQPLAPLSALDGKSVKGLWKLMVEDRGGVNRGTVDSFSIIVTPKAG